MKTIRHLLYHIGFGSISLSILATLLILFPSESSAQSGTQLRLLQSDSNRVVIELTVSNFSSQVRNVGGRNYTVLSIPDFGRTADPGKPEMPIKGTMIGIPPGAEPSLKIIVDESVRDTLANPPIPAPTGQVESRIGESVQRFVGKSIVPDAATYSANRFYPNDGARVASAGNWRSQRFIVVEFHPLQYNPATRELIFHRRLQVEITFTYPRGRTAQALGGPVKEGAFEPILQKSILNYSSAQNWRSPSAATSAPIRQPRYSGGPWFKIAVNADGIYRVTCPELQAAGLVPASLNPNTLQLFDQATELAINVVGSTWNTCTANDYIEFYGQALSTEYTNTNIYWLTHGSATGKRMPTRNGGSGLGSTPTTFTDTLHLEQNKMYRPYTPMNVENADHWFWDFVSAAYGRPSVNFAFQLDRFATSTISATLQYVVSGFNTGGHHTRVYVNGNLVDDAIWNGQTERNATIAISQSILNPGTNSFTVNEPSDVDPLDLVFFNYFKVNYQSTFTAITDTLKFRQDTSGTWLYQIANFTISNIQVFDITDPFSVTRFVNTPVTPASPPFTLQFSDDVSTPKTYIALTDAQRKTASVTLDTVSSLRNPANGADYIIISHSAFISSIQPLVTFRNRPDFRVQVVDVQDVYDDFSDGSMDAQAIRDFLAYAYSNWQTPAPAYVLLVGDATFDPKEYCVAPGCLGVSTTPNSTFVPAFLRMVDPWQGEAASDNRFVSFNDGMGNRLPFMAIGRLPANSTAEVNAMVSKIISYEQNPPAGPWRSTVTFVTDNGYNASGGLDPAGNFFAYSDEIASNPLYLPKPLVADRIYYNPCDPQTFPYCALPYPSYSTETSVRNAIISAFNHGRLIVSYIGHGAIPLWASESLYTTSDITLLNNATTLPVVLAMTCLDGNFVYPNLPSLAEEQVRAANKGALASWSASGLGVALGHDYLEKGFFNAVMNDNILQLGPATVAGKTYLWINSGGYHHDLLDTFVLFGDPASRLQLMKSSWSFLPFIRK